MAFRWSLYLLLSLWPVSVYLGARLFGAGRRAAGGRGRDVAVPGQRHRDRLRAARVRVDRVRGVDPAVGVDDAAAGVGAGLARDPQGSRLLRSGGADAADDRASFRDRIPGADPARALAVGGRRGRSLARVRRAAVLVAGSLVGDRVGDRAAAGAARLGGDERGSARHAARERVRRGTGARLARLRPAARSRPPAGRDAVRRRSGSHWPGAAAGGTRTRGRCWSHSRRACCCRSGGPRSDRWST